MYKRQTLISITVRKDIPVTLGTTAKLGFQGVTGIAHILLEDAGSDETPVMAGAGERAQIPMQDSLIQELTDVGGDTLRNAREFLNSANPVSYTHLDVYKRQGFSSVLYLE